jgi:phage-related protein
MATLFELVGEITTRGVEAAERGIDAVNERAEKLGSQIGDTGDRMSAFGDRVSNVGDKLTGMSTAIAGVVGVAAGFVGKMTAMADETLSASRRLGVSTDALQLWQETAKRFGIQQDALRDGFKELQIRADEFSQTAKGPAAEAFERLGLSQQQVRAQQDDTVGLFNTVLDKIKEVESAAARQRILDELFGGQAAEQFPELMTASREEIQKIQQTVREQGSILSPEELERAREFQRTWQSFSSTLQAVAQRVAIEILPAFESLLENMQGPLASALKNIGTVLGALSEAFAALPGPMQNVIATTGVLVVALGPLLSIVGRLVTGIGKLVSLLSRVGAASAAVGGALKSIGAVLGTVLAVLSRAIAVVGAFFAGWTIGKRVLLPLIEMFPRLDRAIENVIGAIAVEFPRLLAEGWQKIKALFMQLLQFGIQTFTQLFTVVPNLISQGVAQIKGFLSSLLSDFLNVFSNIRNAVISRVSSMVDTVVSKVRAMWQALTGNSIIPQLADEAITEFNRLAGGAEEAGERTRRGMVDSIGSVSAPGQARGGPGTAGGAAASGGGGPQVIDMSHSTFRDDRDMLERLRRKGSDMTAAF